MEYIKYIVIRLDSTEQNEVDFNYTYHKKYIDRVGSVVTHGHNSEVFKDYICLEFAPDDKDWFHKDDLLLVN